MKKRTFISMVCITIVIIIGCIFIFQKSITNVNMGHMNIQEETEASTQEETEISMQEDNEIFFFVSDDITENELFNSFVKGEAVAYDAAEDKEKYVIGYYEEYSENLINVVSFMAEDINGDKEDELLLHLCWQYNEGIILVFHVQDGQLYQWQSIQYGMHSPQLILYDRGIIEVAGTGWSRSFFL